ncbi:MAG TPA: cytochrome c [Noviherbaspirillum sp.]
MRKAVYLLLLCSLAACEKAKQDMYDQPKYKPFRRSELFADGNSSRPLPENGVLYSKGPFAGTSSGRIGTDEVNEDVAASNAKNNPYPVTMQLLRRGQNRYDIYCMPCHSPAGDGDGLIARRGFPHPPSYHSDRLRQVPDRHIFDVITNGYGIMYSYADRVAPPDRWAIAAYIRVLQLSQHADVKKLPPDVRQKLASAAQANDRANDRATGSSTDRPVSQGAAR